MEFFSRQHNKITGIKGIVGAYNDYFKYRYMITNKAKKKTEIVYFFDKFGLEATISAFKISKSSIYEWRKTLRKNKGNIESLNERSKTPINRNKRIIPKQIGDFIVAQRKEHPKLGKDKISQMLKDENIANISESTIGRMLNDLKKQGKIRKNIKITLSGKTGKLIEHVKNKPKKKKIRRNGYYSLKPGDVNQTDSIVKFINGIKRYIITSIDEKSEFAFAYAYSSLSSNTSRDFFHKFDNVAPFEIKHIQTDNGQEFHKYFRDELEKRNIIQFFNYPKRPQMNAKVERFNRTIQEDFIDQNLYLLAYDINQFNQKLMDWLLWYNTKRPHQTLQQQSPIKYLINTFGFSNMLWTSTKYSQK